MTTEGEGDNNAAPAGGALPTADNKNDEKAQGHHQAKGRQTNDQAAPASATAGGDKKLSNAELKKKAKEEKAARRAQAKVATQAAPPAGEAKTAAKNKASQPKQGQGSSSSSLPVVPGHHRSASRTNHPPPAIKEVPKPKIPECFSHLSMAKRTPMTQADKDVDPIVLALGQQMSTFAIGDSTSRLEATLLALKKVIDSYTTPHGNSFSRHFTSHVLNPQIEYLTECRPMCFSMGNAIRWLKLQISKVDIDLADADVKKLLCRSIDTFVHERVVLANEIIAHGVAESIADGSVVLTYAHHKLVEKTLLRAKSGGKDFKVMVIDDPFDRVGIEHSKRLSAAGISVTYVPDLGALRTNVRAANVVLAAAEGVFSNGSIYARAGTADVVISAADIGLSVLVLSETINFTERVSIDSLTFNEIDPDMSSDEGFRLLFDTTKGDYISEILTEMGPVSTLSVPTMLRQLEFL